MFNGNRRFGGSELSCRSLPLGGEFCFPYASGTRFALLRAVDNAFSFPTKSRWPRAVGVGGDVDRRFIPFFAPAGRRRSRRGEANRRILASGGSPAVCKSVRFCVSSSLQWWPLAVVAGRNNFVRTIHPACKLGGLVSAIFARLCCRELASRRLASLQRRADTNHSLRAPPIHGGSAAGCADALGIGAALG